MEALRALGALTEPPGRTTARLVAALGLPDVPGPDTFTDVFGFQLYPYASVYLGPEGMLGGEARERVAGFWTALGVPPPAEPDHLAALLSLYASLAERDQPVRHALLWEHLLSWLVPYLARMREVGGPVYGEWAGALTDLLRTEARMAGPPQLEPLHFRAAPTLPDPRITGARAFLEGLLSPPRTGVIIVRSDLVRAGRELGSGIRVAERSYVLRSLLAQDRPATLAWLAIEARRQAAAHGAAPAELRPVAAWWQQRAKAAAGLLEELAAEPQAA